MNVPHRLTPPDESPVDMSATEEVIIDEALKEKQKIVCTHLLSASSSSENAHLWFR